MRLPNIPFARRLMPGLLGILWILLGSCSYDPEVAHDFCEEVEALPLTPLTAQDQHVVLETPGTIMVIHGSGTAQLGSGDYVKVEEFAERPSYANRAAVILNGWRVRYRGDDQHVRAFGTMLGKIRLERDRVVWNAIGLLRDNDAEEGYEWTYHYTVVIWDGTELDIRVNQDDAEKFCGADTTKSDNFFFAENERTTTALSSFSSFCESPAFPDRGPVAILPRGFGFVYNDDDHHVLQVGYDVDHGETIVDPEKKYRKGTGIENPLTGPASLVGARFVSWDTDCILKDNDNRRSYTFGEMVSACGGSDVGVIQPPFSILPVEDKGSNEPCVTQAGATESHDGAIDQIGYEYAIPMLSGWQLGYGQATKGCDDHHVKEMGVWIDDWAYTKSPGSPTGNPELQGNLRAAGRRQQSRALPRREDLRAGIQARRRRRTPDQEGARPRTVQPRGERCCGLLSPRGEPEAVARHRQERGQWRCGTIGDDGRLRACPHDPEHPRHPRGRGGGSPVQGSIDLLRSRLRFPDPRGRGSPGGGVERGEQRSLG